MAVEALWFVFHCSRATQRECLERLVFATRDNATNRKKLERITAETKVYLLNIETKMLHGNFLASGVPGVIDPGMFGGKFKLQLKVSRAGVRVAASDMLKFGPQTSEPSIEEDVAVTPAQQLPAAGALSAMPPPREVPAPHAATRAPIDDNEVKLLDLEIEIETTLTLKFEPCFVLHSFLRNLDLERYISNFDEAEVTFQLLRNLSEQDLKRELGLPFGPARTIINALCSAVDDAAGSASAASDLSSSIEYLTGGSS